MGVADEQPFGSEPRIDQILAGYLEALEEGRAPRREELLARHPDLAPELERFLEDQGFVERFVDTAELSFHPLLELPQAFGKYELLEELGRGGMGIVYRARGWESDQVVALKMILAGQFATSAEVARFRLETEAAGRLQHPGIVPVLDVGEEGGRHYFTMRYLGGGSLARRLERVREDPDDAARLMVKVARAVQYAHDRGILHRDLKPDNVLIDDDGEPFVGDFGLAKLIERDDSLTLTGALLGAASYLAPEQAACTGAEHTPASDVHGLGLILYELLAGRKAYLGATPLETLRRIAEEEPEPPRRIFPKLPRSLETICLYALQKDPRRRYPSPEAMASDLERHLARRPLVARPPGPAERAVRWLKRRPALTTILVTTLVAAAAIAGIWTFEERRFGDLKANSKQVEERLSTLDTRLQRERWAQHLLRGYELFADLEFPYADKELFDCAGSASPEQEGFPFRLLSHLLHPARDYPVLGLGPYSWAGIRPGSSRVYAGSRDSDVARVELSNADDRRQLHWPGQISGSFSPDGARLALLSSQGTITIADLTTETLLPPREGFGSGIRCCVFLSPGKSLAVADGTGGVSLWDVATRTERSRLAAKGEALTCLTAAMDGRRLAGVDASGALRVWSVEEGALLAQARLEGPLEAVAFSPDGRLLATGASSGAVSLRDSATLAPQVTFRAHEGAAHCVAFSPDGRALATGGADRFAWLWDAASGRPRHLLRSHADAVGFLSFSADGQWLCSTGADRFLVWDAESALAADHWGVPLSLGGFEGLASSVGFSADSRTLRVAGAGSPIRQWTLAGGRRTASRCQIAGLADSQVLALAPDGSLALCRMPGGLLEVHAFPATAANGEAQGEAAIGLDSALTGAFSSEGRLLVVEDAQRRLVLLSRRPTRDGTAWAPARQLEFPEPQPWRVTNPSSLAFSPDGLLLAAAQRSRGHVFLWRVSRDEGASTLSYHPDGVGALAFSPDSRTLVTGANEGHVQFWDLSGPRQSPTVVNAYHRFQTHTGWVTAIAFSPDGQVLATGSEDRSLALRLVRYQDGAPLDLLCGVLREPTGPVRALAFSPDGLALASVGEQAREGGRVEVFVWQVGPP